MALAMPYCHQQACACSPFPDKVLTCSRIHSPDPSRAPNPELMYNLHQEL